MNKAYNRINNGNGWEDYPSINTPINKQNLDTVDIGLDEVDNRVIGLETTKATKVEVSPLFKEVSYDEQTGIITFTRKNGAIVTIDTPMEKIALNIYYDPVTEMLTLPLIDGTQMEVDLSRLITEYEFLDSDTIAFSVKPDGKVTAIVKEGSIEEKHLRPDYLADIKVEAGKAQASATAAAASEAAAAESEQASADSATAAAESQRSAAESASAAAASEVVAAQKAEEARESAEAAAASQESAAESATAADESQKAAAASQEASEASAATASQKAEDASDSAVSAESYAHGGTGTRPGEDDDNAKKYYEGTREIFQGLENAGAVFGVKGDAETEYQHGYVNISPASIGIVEATTEKAGLVRPDGKTIMVDEDGTIVGAASGFTGTAAEVEEAIKNGEIEEGMIVNITDDYDPPHDITPESIGAVAKAGDKMTGLLELSRGSLCRLFFGGSAPVAKLAKIAKITIETAYVDSPLSFTFLSRNNTIESRLYIKFRNSNSTDTSAQYFSYEGGFIDARIERIGHGEGAKFNLYIASSSYERLCLTEYHNSYENTGGIKVEFYPQAPELFDDDGTINSIRATLGGSVAEADHLTNLRSATKVMLTVNDGEVSDTYNAIGYFKDATYFPTTQGGGIVHHAYDQNWKTQLLVAYTTGEIYTRAKRVVGSSSSWTETRKMLDDKNYTDYVVPKTGGTFSGDVTISGGRSLITYNVKGAGSTLSLLSNSSIDCRRIVAAGEASSYAVVNAGAFNTVSSARYKENIVDLSADNAIDHIMKYRPVICNYKDDAEKTPIQAFIAEEVAEINPYPVSCDEEGRPDAIDYSKFVPEIISMLQVLHSTMVKQQEEILELRDKVTILEGELS